MHQHHLHLILTVNGGLVDGLLSQRRLCITAGYSSTVKLRTNTATHIAVDMPERNLHSHLVGILGRTLDAAHIMSRVHDTTTLISATSDRNTSVTIDALAQADITIFPQGLGAVSLLPTANIVDLCAKVALRISITDEALVTATLISPVLDWSSDDGEVKLIHADENKKVTVDEKVCVADGGR